MDAETRLPTLHRQILHPITENQSPEDQTVVCYSPSLFRTSRYLGSVRTLSWFWSHFISSMFGSLQE